MNRFRPLPALLMLAIPLAAPAPAAAAVAHTVGPGETLWGIAAANNLTTRSLAAYNGLPENANVVLGSTINVPTAAEAAEALRQAGIAPAASGSSASGDAPAPMGSYVVRPGDTLSHLAATAGVSVDAIAAMNGLDPSGYLLSGTVIKLPTGSPTPPAATQPAPSETVVPAADPHPTPQRVTSDQISQIAAQHGVPGSLASAIAWQESGFNNSMVSSANARGVMQVMPGTWDWVQQNLADTQLNPDSATDNVKAGVLYLRQLLNETGGDENTAIAGYYQGLGSVRERGLYEDTKRYVENVQALRSRFGG